MDLQSLTQKAAQALSGQTGFSEKVKLDFGDAGKLFLDGEKGTATNEDAEADATMSINWDDFIALAKGQLDPTMAFMSGKIKVLGDMSVVMKLQSLLTKFL